MRYRMGFFFTSFVFNNCIKYVFQVSLLLPSLLCVPILTWHRKSICHIELQCLQVIFSYQPWSHKVKSCDVMNKTSGLYHHLSGVILESIARLCNLVFWLLTATSLRSYLPYLWFICWDSRRVRVPEAFST